ncbi:MAG: hypothetical protein LJE91_14765 [Gammaproteobacteria bacterium]|nr:hypothetical protein [Gammaproteobacteria bacterium]
MRFTRHIGIDYSGAQTPASRLKALQVYETLDDAEPVKVAPLVEGARNWRRLEVAQYCLAAIEAGDPVIIGIDHGFSFPMSYMERYGIGNWDRFLGDFMRHWPTADPNISVEFLREGNARTGEATELRLCERWTTGARSVFQFDVQGSVAKSTHAGLPWLLWLRMMPGSRERLHFWPFDGFDVPEGKSVVAEVFPSLLRRRYPRGDRTVDEHDAWSVAAWLTEIDRRGTLSRYFDPPLTPQERRQAALEGWILGVC